MELSYTGFQYTYRLQRRYLLRVLTNPTGAPNEAQEGIMGRPPGEGLR